MDLRLNYDPCRHHRATMSKCVCVCEKESVDVRDKAYYHQQDDLHEHIVSYFLVGMSGL